MARKNKSIVIFILAILVILVLGYVTILYVMDHKFDKKLAQRCANYNPKWTNIFGDLVRIDDCYGVILIQHAWDIEGYYFSDHVHNYEVAEIDHLDDYKFQDGKIFVKNRAALNCSVTDKYGKKQFCQNLFQDGQMKDNYYDKESDIPLYLIVDTQTGNVEAYKTISEVPENQQNIFQELEQSLPR